MRKILFIIPFFLWTCGGGSKSPTEPSNVAIPAVQNLSIEIEEDTPTVIELPKTNNSASGLTYSISTDSQYGSVSIVNGNATYTPNENYFGTDSFVFSISNGETTSTLATVSITITSVNDAPVVEDIQFVLGSEPFITLIGGDVDGDQITFEIVDNPSSGNISLYENEATYQGNQQDLFTYKANDGELDSNTGTVTLETAATTIQSRLITHRYPNNGSRRFTDGRQYGYSISEAEDGGYLLVGLDGGASRASQGYVVKIDNNLNQLWDNVYSGVTFFNDSQPTSDGGFILCGLSGNLSLTKIDANGNEEWTNTYDGIYGPGQRVIVTSDGGFLAQSSNGGDTSAVNLVKVNSNGDKEWSLNHSTANNAHGHPSDLFEANDGGYYFFHEPNSNISMVKINSSGNVEWDKDLNLPDGTLETVNRANFGFVGSYLPGNESQGFTVQAKIFAINEDGDVLYDLDSTHQNLIIEDIVETNDGFVFTGSQNMGYTEGGSSDTDIFILRTDFYGNQIWAFNYQDSESEKDYGSSNDILIDSDGNFVAVGISWPESGNSSEADIAFIRIDSNGDEVN